MSTTASLICLHKIAHMGNHRKKKQDKNIKNVLKIKKSMINTKEEAPLCNLSVREPRFDGFTWGREA